MTNPAESLLLVALFVGALFFVIWISSRGWRPHSDLLRSLAGRWEGRVHRGGFLRSDWLEIRVDGVPGVVDFGDTNKNGSAKINGWTRVRFDWPSDRRLRVTPEGFVHTIRRVFGGSDISFDDRFWVESSHPTWARSLLDPATRRRLRLLLREPEGGAATEVTLDVGPAGITLRASQLLVDQAADLGSFVELAIGILQKARGEVAAAGVVLESVRVRMGSACPVCGHPVESEKIACTGCGMPHHKDCWKYSGGCAIFACAGRGRPAV